MPSAADGVMLGAVLAGGASRRMGRPKPGALLGGRELIRRPLAAVEQAGLEPAVVAKPSSPLPSLECRVILEPEEPRHPLCGILAALRAAAGRPVVVVACDLPFVPASLIAELAELDAPLAVAAASGREQPLLGRYGPALLPELERALERRDSMSEVMRRLGPVVLDEPSLRPHGDPGRVLFNVNTQADLRRAEEQR